MRKDRIKVEEHSLLKTCKIPLSVISGMCLKASTPFSGIFLIMERLNVRVM